MISPRSARSRRPGISSKSHMSLVPEKYGSRTRPVLSRTACDIPWERSFWQISAERRHCQTMALQTGFPVDRSQRTTVSRWFVMPMAAIWSPSICAASMTPFAASNCVFQISSGSCSTQPGFGKICVKGICFWLITTPALLKSIALDDVVP